MPKIKIATAQSRVSNSISENSQEIRKLMRKGYLKGAKIIHFTEGALSGSTKQQLGSCDQIKFSEIRAELNKIQNLCKELSVWTVIGSAHELSKGNRPHNSMYVISDKGDIVNRYDKRKCSNNEILHWYTPGFNSCNFEVDGIKFGCLLCIEIQFPTLFIEAEEQGIHCLLFSAYSKDKMFAIQAQGYAVTHNYWISLSVPANESSFLSSQFISPKGEVESKCKKNCHSVIICEIDTDSKKWHVPLRLAKPWRKLARIGDIYKEKKVNDKRSKLKTIC